MVSHSQSIPESTGFTGPIYANPSRDLYRHFDLIENLAKTPSGQPKRAYVEGQSVIGNIFSSIWVRHELQNLAWSRVLPFVKNGPIKSPLLIGKQGNISQLGGDFVFGPGEAHENRSSKRDHSLRRNRQHMHLCFKDEAQRRS